MIKKCKNDLKGCWKTIKVAANMPTKSNIQPKIDEQIIDADKMNEHFCEIGPRLNATVPIFKDIAFTDFLPLRNNK